MVINPGMINPVKAIFKKTSPIVGMNTGQFLKNHLEIELNLFSCRHFVVVVSKFKNGLCSLVTFAVHTTYQSDR